MQLVVRFGLVAAALVEPHDGVPQLLELGEDLLALPPEAAGEEGRSSELNVGPLLEVRVGTGDLGVEGHKEDGCGGRSRKPVDEAHDLLAGPLSDDDLVEEDLVDGVVDRSEGALVNVRDGDETVELGVVHQGASDGGSGASKLLGQLDLVGEEELNVLGHARATLRGVQLLVQLDERVRVARDDFAGEGFDVDGAPGCDENEDAGPRPLVAGGADLEEGAGIGERAGARLDVVSLEPLCGFFRSGFCDDCDIFGGDLPEVRRQRVVRHVWDSVKVTPPKCWS